MFSFVNLYFDLRESTNQEGQWKFTDIREFPISLHFISTSNVTRSIVFLVYKMKIEVKQDISEGRTKLLRNVQQCSLRKSSQATNLRYS